MPAEFLKDAIFGAIVGSTMGAPFRGGTSLRKLNFFEPIPTQMAPSEALESWLVFSQHLAATGTAESVSEALSQHWAYQTHETAFGHTAASKGFSAPLCGSLGNPLANGSQALGRAIFWGLAFHGQEDLATEYAYFDASFDHEKEGVWAAVALARMMASAKPGVSAASLLRVANLLLPSNCNTQRVIQIIAGQVASGADPQTIYQGLPKSLPTEDPFQAPLNFGYIVLALLCSNSKTSDALRLAAGFGGASDHTALAAGALASACFGPVESEWLDPLGKAFVCGHGLKGIEPPATHEAFVQKILSACQEKPLLETTSQEKVPFESANSESEEIATPEVSSTSVNFDVEVGPTPVATIAAPEVTTPEPTFSPQPLLSSVRKILEQGPNRWSKAFGQVRVTTEYVDPPVAQAGVSNRLVVHYENIGSAEIMLEPSLQVPSSWSSAHKLTSFRLKQGESSSFAIVVQPPKDWQSNSAGELILSFSQAEVRIPLLSSQRWYWIGPFPNQEGTGFEKQYRCEDILRTGEIFNGRSDLPMQWQEVSSPGTFFELEPFFKEGPGVLYLYARVRFEQSGNYRLICATSTGAMVWVDRQRLVKYLDTHRPIPRAIQPYVAEFSASEQTELLIKVMRGLEPIQPLVLYFLAPDGRVVSPTQFEPMPA